MFDTTNPGYHLLLGNFLSPDFVIRSTNLVVLFFRYIQTFIRYILYKICIINYIDTHYFLLGIYRPIYVYETNLF